MTHSNAYVSTTMKTVVFCLSKKAKLFQWHWEIYLNLPHPNAVKNYYGTIDSLVEIHECENTINSVFSKLINEEKHLEIRFDEIYIKPAIRY